MGRDHGFDRLDARYRLRGMGQDTLVIGRFFYDATIERPLRIPGILGQEGTLAFRSRRDGVFEQIGRTDLARGAEAKSVVEAKDIETDNVAVKKEASRQ